jgi:hypothetical protein
MLGWTSAVYIGAIGGADAASIPQRDRDRHLQITHLVLNLAEQNILCH